MGYMRSYVKLFTSNTSEIAHMATILSFSMMLWLALAILSIIIRIMDNDQWAQEFLHVLRGNMCCLIYIRY